MAMLADSQFKYALSITVESGKASKNAQHVKPWNQWSTTAEDQGSISVSREQETGRGLTECGQLTTCKNLTWSFVGEELLGVPIKVVPIHVYLLYYFTDTTPHYSITLTLKSFYLIWKYYNIEKAVNSNKLNKAGMWCPFAFFSSTVMYTQFEQFYKEIRFQVLQNIFCNLPQVFLETHYAFFLSEM